MDRELIGTKNCCGHFEVHTFLPQADIEPLSAVVQLTAWSLQRLVPYYGKKNLISASGTTLLSLQKLHTFNKTSDVSVH
jgi:hypothetical protein